MTTDLTVENNVRARKNIAPEFRELHCHTDPGAMHQILLNSPSNAIKYNRVGVDVTISLLTLNEETLSIQVADSGLGIAKDKQALLFEPLHQRFRPALLERHKLRCIEYPALYFCAATYAPS